MPFIKMSGIAGKVFVPEGTPLLERKHPCADCFCCQHCADDRCTVCREETASKTAPPPACCAHRKDPPPKDDS